MAVSSKCTPEDLNASTAPSHHNVPSSSWPHRVTIKTSAVSDYVCRAGLIVRVARLAAGPTGWMEHRGGYCRPDVPSSRPGRWSRAGHDASGWSRRTRPRAYLAGPKALELLPPRPIGPYSFRYV